jgi:choline monooxygenase
MDRLRFLTVAKEIRRASTLPGWVYSDPVVFEAARERVFSRSWTLVGDTDRTGAPGHVLPFTLLEGCLNEPLLLVRDQDRVLRCLSNVCTHRGNLVADKEGIEPHLRCRYHGRRFTLGGRLQFMPEFEGVEGFPAPSDDLPRLDLGIWRKFVFVSPHPAHPFDDLVHEMEARCGWLPLESAVLDPARSRDYEVRASWALYCDNYLEGFHIPYVHAGLNEVLDYGGYRTELFPWAVLQVGEAAGTEDVFDLPRSSPDHGKRIAAYYFWLFPATMFNLYPWGISINCVQPLAPDRTRVSFLSYVWDAARLERGAGAGLHKVEMEDEAIVEAVQKGAASRLASPGRYSPTRELGVHHFHRLLARALAQG